MLKRTVFEEEHQLFQQSVQKFLQTEAAPFHSDWEENGIVSRDIWLKAGKLGFLVPSMPEKYGGFNADFRYNTIINEEIWRQGLTGLGFALHSDVVVPYIIKHATDELKSKLLPLCLTGEVITAIAMTEPDTGSDLQNIKTTAVRDKDKYIVNGSKTFISNGQSADWVIVVCKTAAHEDAKGISLLLVDTRSDGFNKGRNLDKIGLKAQDTSELFFQNVEVPIKNLLGNEGEGFRYLMQELPQERLSISIGAVASCESVLEQTIEYVKNRKAFGSSISTFQNTQFVLAELDSKITAIRVFVDHCLALHLSGKLDSVTASKAKLLSTELQDKVVDECLQLHGGYGYIREYPVAKAYADSRVQRIYGGTSEIMKLIIARSLFENKA